MIVKQNVPAVIESLAEDLDEEDSVDLLEKKIKTLHFSALADLDS